MNELIEKVSLFYKENAFVINIVAGFVIFLLFLLLRNKVAGTLSGLLAKLLSRGKEERKAKLKEMFQKPLALLLGIIGLFLALHINIESIAIVKGFKIAVILVICWGLLNYLSGNLFNILHIGDDTDKINVTAVRFITNILKVLLIALAVVMVISELGYDISGLITGIGVGGLAVSLAAQDAVSNLISGFVIVAERPFKVGDFVKINDVVGTVDDVAMRSTRLRTLDDCLVTLPNSSVTNAPIVNYSRIEHRLIDMEIGLVYSTSNELLQKCQQEIREFLTADEEIIPSPMRVEFTKLDDSSLTLSIFCYVTTADIYEYNRILSKVNYGIKEIVEKNGASFAFPSTSVYLEKND